MGLFIACFYRDISLFQHWRWYSEHEKGRYLTCPCWSASCVATCLSLPTCFWWREVWLYPRHGESCESSIVRAFSHWEKPWISIGFLKNMSWLSEISIDIPSSWLYHRASWFFMATIHGFLMLKPLVDPMFLPRILEIGSKDQHSGLQGLGIQWGYAGDISATINGLKVWEHIYIYIFSLFFLIFFMQAAVQIVTSQIVTSSSCLKLLCVHKCEDILYIWITRNVGIWWGNSKFDIESVYIILSCWWFGTYIGNDWDCHDPNWRTPSFFRGVGIPPTSYHFNIIFDVYNWWWWCWSTLNRFLLVESNPPTPRLMHHQCREQFPATTAWCSLIYYGFVWPQIWCFTTCTFPITNNHLRIYHIFG